MALVGEVLRASRLNSGVHAAAIGAETQTLRHIPATIITRWGIRNDEKGGEDEMKDQDKLELPQAGYDTMKKILHAYAICGDKPATLSDVASKASIGSLLHQVSTQPTSAISFRSASTA